MNSLITSKIPTGADELSSAMDLSAFSYQKFVQFALEEIQLRTTISPRPFQENLKYLRSKDGNATLRTLSFKAPKIRHLRSLTIEGSPAMQVLDFAAFPEPKFDFPIFCANFFTTSTLSIIVLFCLGETRSQMHEVLYAAFKDYFKAWLVLMELAMEGVDEPESLRNCEAHHKYLTWRAEKDPGHQLLKRLIGENLAREMIRHFLFEGLNSLGSKTFLDYFPEYRCEDGSINQKRSIIGKAYKTRPWDSDGEFIGNERL